MITKLAWALKKISFNDLLSFQPCKIYSLDLVHYMYILHESFSYTTIIPLLVIWPTNRRFFYTSRTYKFCMICGYHLPFSKDKMLIRFLSLQPKLLSLFHNTHTQSTMPNKVHGFEPKLLVCHVLWKLHTNYHPS